MEMTNRLTPLDGFVLAAALAFSLGCITTAHRPARTIDPGQISVGGSYVRAQRAVITDIPDAEPIQLAALDARFGAARGVDFGIAHTWDMTADNEGAFNTLWGDVKVQLTNRDNLERVPTLSTGLLKGYLYDTGDEDGGIHITSIPLVLDYRINRALTPFVFYRYELVRESFIPSDVFSDIRHTFGIGAEIDLAPGTGGWRPKLGLAIGRYNSLDGGDGHSGTILNAGLTLTSPGRPRD
jgi:hypothetical protein